MVSFERNDKPVNRNDVEIKVMMKLAILKIWQNSSTYLKKNWTQHLQNGVEPVLVPPKLEESLKNKTLLAISEEFIVIPYLPL